jgi:tagatose 1,6-diphosphate aldolase
VFFWRRRFRFLDPGPLIDGELELVQPHPRWFEDVLQACRHPLTVQHFPTESQTTRKQLELFIRAAPAGHESAKSGVGNVPQYHFWMVVRNGIPDTTGLGLDPLRLVGGIGLRIGSTYPVEMYYGHLGYHVFPIARGRHYAERACRLLLPLARQHGLKPIWITCNPDNYASRRTCERLGARLVSIVPVPEEDPLYQRGETEKCRYRLD